MAEEFQIDLNKGVNDDEPPYVVSVHPLLEPED
jgi:hypothetical protein